MRYYEILYIINPNLEDNGINKIIDEIEKDIIKHKVTIINHGVWGKKRLAYPIRNNKYGIYILLQFSAEQFDFLQEFERYLILNKSIIRHQVVKIDKEPAKIEKVESVEPKIEAPEIEDEKKPAEPVVEEKSNEVEETVKIDIEQENKEEDE